MMKKESKIIPVNPTETREAYEAPVVTAIEVRVEQGFQVSGLGGNPNDDDDPGGSF